MNSKQPLVSVVVPTHNLQNYIENTLQTIVNQDYKNIEIIVVDNNSSDNTFAIIQELAKKNSHISVIQNKQQQGPGATRNKGIQAANGEYLSFIDGDDEIAPDFISTLVNALEENKNINIASVGYSWGGKLTNQKIGQPSWESYSKKKFFTAVSTRGHSISGMVFNKLYRLDLVKKADIYFDETLKLAEDHLWIAQIVASPLFGNEFLADSTVRYFKINRSDSIIHTATYEMRQREHEIDQQIAKIKQTIN